MAGTFITSVFSYDHNFEKYNSGLGILATIDKVGIGGFQSSSISGLYAYHIPLNNDWKISGGLQFTYSNRNINFYELTFNDQIKDGAFTGNPSLDNAAASIQGISAHFFDFSTGFMLFNKNVWLGISAHHLNKPNQSLNTAVESHLPVKLSLQAGFKLSLNPTLDLQKAYLIPSILYRKQDIFQQIDFNLSYQYGPVLIGVSYRGFPFQQLTQGYFNQDALIISGGFKYETLQFYYSHDVTISKLNGTGGSNEIGLIFDFASKKKNKSFILFPFFIK